MWINITVAGLGNFNLNVLQITKIVENSAGAVVVNTVSGQENYEPSETMNAIFNQQNVTGKSLNMILITNIRFGNREIWFTHALSMITPLDGGGSVLHLRIPTEKVKSVETIATISAYQTGKQLGMIEVDGLNYGPNPMKRGSSVPLIVMSHMIKKIVSLDVSNAASNAVLMLVKGDSHYELNSETVLNLFNNQA